MECFASVLFLFSKKKHLWVQFASYLLAHDKSVSGESNYTKKQRELLSATEKQYS